MAIDINSLTIGEAKELARIFGGTQVASTAPKNPAIGKYCIIRCQKAGVHAGTLVEYNSEFLELKDSRRLWYWKSKFTLTEAANYGIEGDKSKIADTLDQLIIPISDVGEIIPTTDKAMNSIKKAKVYNA